MASRPPRTGTSKSGLSGKSGGFSVSRQLSERSRATRAQPDLSSDGIGGVVQALHGLIDQLRTAASQTAPEQESFGTEQSSDGLHAGVGDAAAAEAPAGGVVRSVTRGGKGARMVFGYTVRMGLDGVTAEPFGDMPDMSDMPDMPDTAARAAASRPAMRQPAARQPIVELFEEAATIVVIAELPGADPARLSCRVEGDMLLIETDGARRYRKRLALPAAVAADTLRHSFLNGILEVRLTRVDAL